MAPSQTSLFSHGCYFFPDIDLKKAAKSFAQKYSCGSSVTGDDEIVIQGDVLDDLLDFIPEKWPEVKSFLTVMFKKKYLELEKEEGTFLHLCLNRL